MKAMLKVLNITSYYMVVYAGDNYSGLIHEMPGLQFNHAILCVPVEKDTIFIDCTLKGVPAGYLGTFTQGREALLVDNDSSRIIKLPELKTDEVKEFSHHRYNLTAENNCTVNLSSRIRGYKFDYLSTAEEYLNHNDLESLFRDRYFNFSSFELKNRNLKTS
ncbi:MAG: hypothetical protein HC830_04885 [Bacteroidetes bacterium]|nr:hypothetical protein [Bacteroidota bacterium]